LIAFPFVSILYDEVCHLKTRNNSLFFNLLFIEVTEGHFTLYQSSPFNYIRKGWGDKIKITFYNRDARLCSKKQKHVRADFALKKCYNFRKSHAHRTAFTCAVCSLQLFGVKAASKIQ
jgi:hypothetical protein